MPVKLVKILSGPHFGAEVELTDRPLTLGTDAGCDLVLFDSFLGQRHLALSLRDGTALVEFFEKGYIQNRPMAAGESAPLEDGEVIAAGATYLCTGPADSRWQEILLPDWVALNGVAPSGTTASLENPGSGPGPGASNNGADAPFSGVEGMSSHRGAPPARARLSNKKAWVAGLGLVAAVVLAFGGILSLRMFVPDAPGPTDSPDAAPEDNAAVLTALCAEKGLHFDMVEEVPHISGEVESQADALAVHETVLSLVPEVDYRVHSREEIVAAVKSVISGYEYPIAVEGVSGGVVSLRGWAPSDAELQQILVDLKHDVPGVTGFDTSVMFLTDIRETIANELGKQGLEDIQIVLNDGNLLCGGTIPKDKEPVWKACLARWKEQFPVLTSVKDDTVAVTPLEPAPAAPDPAAKPSEFRIASVMFAPLRYFVTAEGTAFYEGARLPDGFVVESIAHEGIVLRRGDERKEMPLPFGKSAAAGGTRDTIE